MTREQALKDSVDKCKDLVGFEINQVSTVMVKGLPMIQLQMRRGVEYQNVLITSNQKGTKAGYIK
tara:strand:- start:3053 stop:3247 length:195 start_codon:yes stop_codon:yes gene_type:complete